MCSNNFVGAAGASRQVRRALAARMLDVAATRWPIGWCLRMQSLTRNPPQHIDNAWSKSIIPAAPRYSQAPFESNVPRLSAKNRTAKRQDRNHLLGIKRKLSSGVPGQLIHTDSPSPAARSCLQPLSLEASPHLEDVKEPPWLRFRH